MLHYHWMTLYLNNWHYPNKQQLEYSPYTLTIKKSQHTVYAMSIKNGTQSNLSISQRSQVAGIWYYWLDLIFYTLAFIKIDKDHYRTLIGL